jgi:hypothetical protein
MKKIVSLLIIVVMLCLGLVIPISANPPALPTVPSNAVLQQVISQSGPVTYVPLGVPDSVMLSLANFGGVLNNVENMVDENQAVNYIATGGLLKETVIPLINSGSVPFSPNITAPGSNPKPGRILGALYQPTYNTRVLVGIFKSGNKLDKIRMYSSNTAYQEYSVYVGNFASSVAGTYDEGALISHKLSCVTVSNKQVCWDPINYNVVREEPYPKNVIYAAYTRAKNKYDLKNDFFVDDAVPDIIGTDNRTACSNALMTLGAAACDPNLYFSAAKEKSSNNVIGLFVVDSPADVTTFNTQGIFIGSLPAGEYVVINATPNITTQGQIGVLFLVNINSNTHYLIPSVRIQQHAQSDAFQKPVASIKDGATWYYGWGW